jgi:acetyltransferase-like isoleucine patch superfamily enzyme
MSDIAQTVKMGANVTLSADTIIGDKVTIGNNVTFYPGVTVEAGCTIFDGAVIGRPPKSAGNTTRAISATPQPLVIGEGSIIGANAVLYTGITIGKNVLVGDLASVREGCVFGDQVVVGRGCLVMYDTRIGHRSRVIDGAILTGNMLIEEDVFIGPGVNSVNDNDVYLKRYGLEDFSVEGPIIRRFALIGTGANLAAGIEIGMGAIVAPSAMVTHNVAPWTIVAGVPAKVMKGVAPEQRDRILAHFNEHSTT